MSELGVYIWKGIEAMLGEWSSEKEKKKYSYNFFKSTIYPTKGKQSIISNKRQLVIIGAPKTI